MPAMEKKSLNEPEETNTPEKLKMEAVTIRGLTSAGSPPNRVERSKHLKPLQKTNNCKRTICCMSSRADWVFVWMRERRHIGRR